MNYATVLNKRKQNIEYVQFIKYFDNWYRKCLLANLIQRYKSFGLFDLIVSFQTLSPNINLCDIKQIVIYI